jgi:hypothetical protein
MSGLETCLSASVGDGCDWLEALCLAQRPVEGGIIDGQLNELLPTRLPKSIVTLDIRSREISWSVG